MSVAPASDLAHLDPAHYSDAGPEAQAAVAWMRDVARAIRDSTTKRELQNAMYEARQVTVMT